MKRHSSADGKRVASKKLLSKAKDDILIQPRKPDFETKLVAKEIERARKWQNMAIIDRHTGIIQYHFPLTKKVFVLGGVDNSCCNGHSKGFQIVGEL